MRDLLENILHTNYEKIFCYLFWFVLAFVSPKKNNSILSPSSIVFFFEATRCPLKKCNNFKYRCPLKYTTTMSSGGESRAVNSPLWSVTFQHLKRMSLGFRHLHFMTSQTKQNFLSLEPPRCEGGE